MEKNVSDEHKVLIINANEKNKFKFEWLDKSATIKLPASAHNVDVTELSVKVGDCIKKIEVSGTVNCQLCCDTIYYGKRGFIDVHLYQVDKFLQSHADEHGNILRIDVWWAAVFASNKYSALSKMVWALLSCFHGPQVESSFSIMGDVMGKQSGNMNIEIFSAIQTVKYKLSSQNKSAIDFFKKDNFLHDQIDNKLCRNMKTSYHEYQKQLENKKQEIQKKRQKLNATKDICSKIKTNCLIKEKENNLRLIHKKRLEKLVENKQLKKRKLN